MVDDNEQKTPSTEIPGVGEPGSEEEDAEARTQRAAFELVHGTTESDPRLITPREQLIVHLKILEGSRHASNHDIYKVVHGMIMLDQASFSVARDGPRAFTERFIDRIGTVAGPELGSMPRDMLVIMFDDSLDEMSRVFDYIEAEPFTLERQHELLATIADSNRHPVDGLEKDPDAFGRLMNAFKLSYELTNFDATNFKKTPQQLILEIRNELLHQALGIEVDTSLTEEQEHELMGLRSRAWETFARSVR